MKFFEEHDLNYWLERCMLLALENTKDLDLDSGDASFTALAANFLDIAGTVILDREGIREEECVVYGTNKGNLGIDKLSGATRQIQQVLDGEGLESGISDGIINKIAELGLRKQQGEGNKKLRTELGKFISEKTKLDENTNKKLVAEIFQVAHPARIALETACKNRKRRLIKNEYLVDFSLHHGARVIITMESEGAHVTGKFAGDFATIAHGSIYWDFFKLLNVSSKYKFLLAIENTSDSQEHIRESIKNLLDIYIADNNGKIVEDEMWIFIFHPKLKHPQRSDLPGFDMYSVEVDDVKRRTMSSDAIESFLFPSRETKPD